MKKITFPLISIFILFCYLPLFSGCSSNKSIKMYNVETKLIETLDFEDYIAGVVAGEMYNDWPIEALKAQCVLARTFTIDFLKNQKSKYKGADISNDISEAQAYNKNLINDKIKQAVNETKGIVIIHNDEPINAWFHSNSGGTTELATFGLNYSETNPVYIKSIKSPETQDNSQNYSWEYTFTKGEILKALSNIGISVTSLNSIQISEKSPSGRAIQILVGEKNINANTFRLAIGSTKLKSTLIQSITQSGENVTFKGLGYGHGVGMSQWGAKILAQQDKDYNYIINYYFDNVKIVKN